MAEEFIAEQLGRVNVHTFIASTDAAVDEWGQAVHQVMESTPPNQPFLILVDVSYPGVVFTPYARETTQTLVDAYRQRKGRMCYIFEWKSGPHIARMFFAALGKVEFDLNYFSSREEGVAWLKELDSTS